MIKRDEARERKGRAFTCLFILARTRPFACQSREPSPAAHASTILKVELEIRREPLRTPRPPGLLPPRSSYLDSSTHRPFSKRLDRICSRTKIYTNRNRIVNSRGNSRRFFLCFSLTQNSTRPDYTDRSAKMAPVERSSGYLFFFIIRSGCGRRSGKGLPAGQEAEWDGADRAPEEKYLL